MGVRRGRPVRLFPLHRGVIDLFDARVHQVEPADVVPLLSVSIPADGLGFSRPSTTVPNCWPPGPTPLSKASLWPEPHDSGGWIPRAVCRREGARRCSGCSKVDNHPHGGWAHHRRSEREIRRNFRFPRPATQQCTPSLLLAGSCHCRYRGPIVVSIVSTIFR